MEMRVLTNLKDTVATDALIGRLPIGARHSTKVPHVMMKRLWSIHVGQHNSLISLI
jgi:hypothetical protein